MQFVHARAGKFGEKEEEFVKCYKKTKIGLAILVYIRYPKDEETHKNQYLNDTEPRTGGSP